MYLLYSNKKMDKIKIFIYSLIFLVGFLSCLLIIMAFGGAEMPLGLGYSNNNPEAPGNWVKTNQINVYDNAIVIAIEGTSLSKYASTGSMKPVLDKDSNGIRIKPENAEQIDIGDIVTFEQDNELIIHRVIEKGKDEKGTWFITKGDNNNVSDGKIYFQDIRYVTIGVLW